MLAFVVLGRAIHTGIRPGGTPTRSWRGLRLSDEHVHLAGDGNQELVAIAFTMARVREMWSGALFVGSSRMAAMHVASFVSDVAFFVSDFAFLVSR